MPFNIPTLRKIIADGQRDIEIEMDIPALPPVGVENAINIAFSSQIRDIYDHQRWIADQIIPSPKSDDQTIIDTAASEGVIRKQPTFAAGPAVFNSNNAMPVDTEMQTANGSIYRVIASAQPVNGTVTVRIQADDTGVGGNLPAGEILTLLSPIAGTDSNGMVSAPGITGGADLEPIAELLDRLLFRKRNPPVGGAVHDYVLWAREMAGVSRAWCFDGWHGTGTVGLAWVYDDRTDITPSDADRAAMDVYLFRHPDPATGLYVGKPGGIEVWSVALTLKPVPLSIKLTPDTSVTRSAVQASLITLQKQLSPGQKLHVSSLRTAIGATAGITDYTLSVSADVSATTEELITIGAITWLTA
ncbi:baseplate J/gp47 family protein [Edwardsiella piscicida]|uniref:baseplate J/gp47 family protein n=1 Tax=Edwardsiella piscicida TaxID=1263550 RepID=UPI00247861FF|nr:baseplate J/gp47 family protein [Edwardsiella piscicida]ELM3734792.1 baseplate J/gp47 family protein [Edwardsiella piscicida]WGS78510.1 baseplate J/gp47 family protein [Edwardsiella piscicida]WGS81895.1 baseplate J/gp47 family protein [Edwardsiella piscicida]